MHNSLFIYAISFLYAAQGVLYATKDNWPMAGLVMCYAIAGIPLIIMGK